MCDVGKNPVCCRLLGFTQEHYTYILVVSGTVILSSLAEHLPNMIKLLSRDEIRGGWKKHWEPGRFFQDEMNPFLYVWNSSSCCWHSVLFSSYIFRFWWVV
jgi:hypothetical protein